MQNGNGNHYTESHKILMVKPAQRNLNPDVIAANMNDLLNSVNTKSLKVQGWLITRDESALWRRVDTPGETKKYRFESGLVITYQNASGIQPDKRMLSGILRTINMRAPQPPYGQWSLGTVDGDEYEVAENEAITGNASDMLAYSDVQIPPDFDNYFGHLFGLDMHIGRVRRAIDAAVQSQWSNRFHCALVGPPGCGKSDICKTVKAMLGSDAVFEFDATSTTAAGAIKKLSEAEILPRVIIIEEIEKAPEASMQFLLGILDLRAEINKTTARGEIQRETKLLALATVNDYALFTKLQAGALASRFMNKVHFNLPSRETLALILGREVRKVAGNEKWIAPTLDYCESKGITDPRQVIAIALCGQDELLDGSYQKMLDATSLTASKGNK